MRQPGLDWFVVEVGVVVVCAVVVLLIFPHQKVMDLLSNPASIRAYGQLITEVLLRGRSAVVANWLFAFPIGVAVSYLLLVVSGPRRAGL
ncbi:MAG: hypothetical protein ACRDIY_19035 [Chloroflexota bacterium]